MGKKGKSAASKAAAQAPAPAAASKQDTAATDTKKKADETEILKGGKSQPDSISSKTNSNDGSGGSSNTLRQRSKGAKQQEDALASAAAAITKGQEENDDIKQQVSPVSTSFSSGLPLKRYGIPRPAKPNLEGLDKKRAFKVRRVAVMQYAVYLGMDLDVDLSLLFIADEGLYAPVPKPWEERFDARGQPYFYNTETKESRVDHPRDGYYRDMYRKMCKLRPEEEKQLIENKRQAELAQRRVQKERIIAMMPKPPSKLQIYGRRAGLIALALLSLAGLMLLFYQIYSRACEFDSRGPWAYQVLALMGSVEAQLYTGTTFLEGVHGVPIDGEAALTWFHRANQTNHPGATRMIGLCYYKGRGVEMDYVEAARLFIIAAKRGDVPAKAFAGFMYYKGQGLPVDYIEAVTLTREAADYGDHNAAFNLALIFQEGQAVTRNYANAYMWYLIASASPDLEGRAKQQMDWLLPRLRGGEEQAAAEAAIAFRPKT